jgi:hypothetical protein
MFELYTEKARRVIFYARYETSQYGGLYIETEHLLLGLLREDYTNVHFLLPAQLSMEKVRNRVESEIIARERISTSVEIPLSAASKRVLNLAAATAEQCGHRHIGTEHILMGLLRVEEGLAYEILHEQEFDLTKLEERLPQMSSQVSGPSPAVNFDPKTILGRLQPFPGPEDFLNKLRAGNWQELRELFAENAVLVDANGKRLSGHSEIFSNLERLLAPFVTKNAKCHVEAAVIQRTMIWVGTILWDHIHLKPKADPGRARMTLAFASDSVRWSLSLLQITSVTEPQFAAKTAPD